MAAPRKATVTKDVANENSDAVEVEQESVATLTDPDMKADVESVKTYKVKSPTGSVTEVPEGILDALLDSGYSKTK